MKKALFLFLSTMLLSASTLADELTFYGVAYPNFENKKARELVNTELKQLKQFHIRLSANWAKIEARKGRYDFEPLEEQLNFARSRGLKVLLTIESEAPEWACRNADCTKFSQTAFRKLIAHLVLKYEGQFQQIQFGSEWDYYGWDGSIKTIIDFQNNLYDVVKILAPDIEVLLGGISSLTPATALFCDQTEFPNLVLSSKYLEPRGYVLTNTCRLKKQLKANLNDVLFEARFDGVDLHLNGLCQYWPDYIKWLKTQTDKAIVIGEYSFSEQETLSIAQCLQTLDQMEIKQAYFYPVFDLAKMSFRNSLFD